MGTQVTKKKSGKIYIASMLIAAITGALALILYPNVVMGVWKILAWLAAGTGAVSAGVLHHVEKKKEKLLEEQELARIRRKRREQSQKERAELQKRVEKAQAKAALREEERVKKQLEIKAEMVQQADDVWTEKEKYALYHEKVARDIVASTLDMRIKEAAGTVAIEWSEAAALAKWTAQELIMFSRRPPVTTEARDEAREAKREAARQRALGNVLTREKGEALRKKKEKARLEEKIEEDRLDTIRDFVASSERKWKIAETRADRGQEELDALMGRR